MIRQVKKTMKRCGMVEKGERVIVAVSGGMDSVCLLNVLVELRAELDIELLVCHLNHMLRGDESMRDEVFVKRLAEKFNLPFEAERVDAKKGASRMGVSLQEAARFSRYAFFEDAARRHGAGKVALGHNRDDNAETVMMRLIKGSSLKGLRGIPPVRDMYIRPLSEVSRKDIRKYMERGGIRYVEDSSNKKMNYLRNRIRRKLIPFIEEEFNPNITETLTRTAMILAREDEYMADVASRVYNRSILHIDADKIVLDVKGISTFPDAIMMRVLNRSLIHMYESHDKRVNISTNHLEGILRLVNGIAPNASIVLPAGLRVVREYGRLIMTMAAAQKKREFKVALNIPGETYIEDIACRFESYLMKKSGTSIGERDRKTACFDYEKLSVPLWIRGFRPGDRMIPMGIKGHKKVKDIFIDSKTPGTVRGRIPLLVSGSDIIWVAGLRQSEIGKVEKGTKRVLKVVVS